MTKITEELLSKYFENITDTMCYITSQKIFMHLCPKYSHVIFNNTHDFYDHMKLSSSKIFNIELLIETQKSFTQHEKDILMQKYNIKNYGYSKFVFNKDKLRPFMHAFNIFKNNDNVLIAQSWCSYQKYNVIWDFNHDKYHNFIKYLIKAFNEYPKNIHKLYKAFRIKKHDIKKIIDENIIKLLHDNDFSYNFEFRVSSC